MARLLAIQLVLIAWEDGQKDVQKTGWFKCIMLLVRLEARLIRFGYIQ